VANTQEILEQAGVRNISRDPFTRIRSGTLGELWIGLRFAGGGWEIFFEPGPGNARLVMFQQAGLAASLKAGARTATLPVGFHEHEVRNALRRIVLLTQPSPDTGSPSAPAPMPPAPMPPAPMPPSSAWPGADIRSFTDIYTPAECAEFAARGFTPAEVRALLGM
jgi:hypothetical protein